MIKNKCLKEAERQGISHHNHNHPPNIPPPTITQRDAPPDAHPQLAFPGGAVPRTEFSRADAQGASSMDREVPSRKRAGESEGELEDEVRQYTKIPRAADDDSDGAEGEQQEAGCEGGGSADP